MRGLVGRGAWLALGWLALGAGAEGGGRARRRATSSNGVFPGWAALANTTATGASKQANLQDHMTECLRMRLGDEIIEQMDVSKLIDGQRRLVVSVITLARSAPEALISLG
jgi:hypothetical protein